MLKERIRKIFFISNAIILPGLIFFLSAPKIKLNIGEYLFGNFMFFYTCLQISCMLDFGVSRTLAFKASSNGSESVHSLAKDISIGIFAIFIVGFCFFNYSNIFGSELVSNWILSIVLALYVGCHFTKSILDGIEEYFSGAISRILTIIALVLPPIWCNNLTIIMEIYLFLFLTIFSLNVIFIKIYLGMPLIKKPINKVNHIKLPPFYQAASFSIYALIVISNYGERLVLTQYVDIGIFGSYVLMTEIILKLLLPSSVFNTLLFGEIRKNQPNNYLKILRKTIILCVPITWILTITVVFCLPEIYMYWMKESIIISKEAFIAQVAGVFLNSIAALFSGFLEATGHQLKRFIAFLFYIPVQMLFTVFLISSYGVDGAAFAWLAKGVLEMVVLSFAILVAFKLERKFL